MFFVLAIILLSYSIISILADEVRRPVYLPQTTKIDVLKNRTAFLLAMDDDSIKLLVPPQSGFVFVGCPNCKAGSTDEQLIWSYDMGDKVKCKYCNHIFPDDIYPENGQITLITPSGGYQNFKFYKNSKGLRYWFEARRWFEQRQTAERGAYDLAQLWNLTGDAEAGRKAAIILKRFADLYPDYIIHYDYPGDPKRFFTDKKASESDILTFSDHETYRAAKWTCWAYMDVSQPLAKAYDMLVGSTFLTEKDCKHIENDFLRAMVGYVKSIKDPSLTNMHPYLWGDIITVSKVLNDPELILDILPDIQRILKEQFFYDGFWKESTVAYHLQTVNSLKFALSQLQPQMNDVELDKWFNEKYPELMNSIRIAENLRFPNGYYVTVGDTWPSVKSNSNIPIVPKPSLLPAFGYAVLENQIQAHLNFTGKYGHHHLDSLGLNIYANDKELISDIGYTHTRYRPWATSTLSHNTVVIDQKNQFMEGSERSAGNLLMFNTRDPAFQIVQAEMPGAYKGVVSTYKRTLSLVESSKSLKYVIDIFDVVGGQQHDWFLHGSADEFQTLDITDQNMNPINMTEIQSMLPPGLDFAEPEKENDDRIFSKASLTYGMLKQLRMGKPSGFINATFKDSKNPLIGVCTWINCETGTEVYSAISPAVRGAKSDDAKLADFWRQTLIVRHNNNTSRFIAVHCPFTDKPQIKKVSLLKTNGNGFILKIEYDRGKDYFAYNDNGICWANDGKDLIELDGQMALAQMGKSKPVLKMINGKKFRINKHVIRDNPVNDLKLVSVKGNQLICKGKCLLKANDTIVIKHADGKTTALKVANISNLKDTICITTVEPEIFKQKENGDLELKYFPNTILPAPHIIKASRLSKNR